LACSSVAVSDERPDGCSCQVPQRLIEEGLVERAYGLRGHNLRDVRPEFRITIASLVLLTVACGGGLEPPAESSDEGSRSGETTTPASATGTTQQAPTTSVATTPTSEAPPVTETTPADPPNEEGEEGAPTTTRATNNEASDISPGMVPLVEQAVADLADRLGVEEGQISVLAAEAVVWPDGALGCPRDGMVYTQVLVDGFRILLEAGGYEYAYHGGGDKGPFLCEKPSG
jgi:hypothetical protein